ncbi:glycosyltransferase family 18 protein [Athelia psychrophila]|uniref:Glycosyltransferase family 18 protein n=1 Tax=Athelia psychrophila TaxID=1759441 RepID=A0A165Y9X2_9AGAM|nr:glycosyltransferase family 18 protein [Fibularhizoctonia sp. CBS 109695]
MDSYVGETNKALRELLRCMEFASCGPNQQKVVILQSAHFRFALAGWVGGEQMWARSTVHALRELGYTFLYASSLDRAVQLYQLFPTLVRAMVVEPEEADDCWLDTAHCLLSDENPDGIPAWKIFTFMFWTGPANPLGRRWTLSPEDYALEGHTPNIHLGYSVEPSCLLQPFLPAPDRPSAPPQAYLMTKRLAFLNAAWPAHFFAAAQNATGISFVMGASWDGREGDGAEPPSLPEGVRNVGMMDQHAFLAEVARSRVLVGVGKPVASPTPYEALCLGVPFINPIMTWDRNNPTDRTKWDGQHGLLKLLDPPFVYNVFAEDLDGFVAAIKGALENPIERHVLERMRMSAVMARVEGWLEHDWRREAAALLESWEDNDEGLVSI